MKTFGEILKEKRKAAGYTQEKLAEKIGYTRRQVANWELEKSFPNGFGFTALAKAFNCTIDEFFDRELVEVFKDEKIDGRVE